MQIQQVNPVLQLFSDENFRGVSRTFRGNIAIRNVDLINDAESLRFTSTNPNASLVLFSRRNFQGAFRILHGNQAIRDVEGRFGEEVESLVSTNLFVTRTQVLNLQRTGILPASFRIFGGKSSKLSNPV